jgi:hypothetical protein
MKKIINIKIILILIIVLVGCVQKQFRIANTPDPRDQTLPDLEIMTGTKMIQKTKIPTQLTPTPTLISYENSLLPSLSSNEAEERLIRLLKNNGNCNLPCVLGITPGISSKKSLQSLMSTFNLITKNGHIQIVKDKEIVDTSIYAEGGQEDQSDTIQYILFRTEAYEWQGDLQNPLYGNQFYKDYFEYYNLSGLLKNYGTPANTYFLFEASYPMADPPDLIFLYLDYSDYGWFARIIFPAGWDGKTGFEGCPKNGFTTIMVWEPSEKNWKDYWEGHGSIDVMTFEEMTSISAEKFYDMYMNSMDTCFEFDLADLKK